MKLLSYLHAGREGWGVVVADGVVALAERTGHATLADFICSDDYARRNAWVQGLKADLPLAGLHHLPVIPRAEKIVLKDIKMRTFIAQETGRDKLVSRRDKQEGS